MTKVSQKNMIPVEFINKRKEVVSAVRMPVIPQIGQSVSLSGNEIEYEITDVIYLVGGQFKVQAQIEPKETEADSATVSSSDSANDAHRPWMVFTAAIIIIWINFMILVMAKSCGQPAPVTASDAAPSASVSASASASAPAPTPNK